MVVGFWLELVGVEPGGKITIVSELIILLYIRCINNYYWGWNVYQ